ncbi:hypothetical protein KEM52_005984 [Ascosphaera acerosa]|nr:hypothetical protein KEM52_005984 [Ascosphaera acerosa]
MKVFSSTCTFDYSWDEVSTANWRKYCPWNDKSTHVVAVDVLSREVDAETGVLRTERLITCQQTAPRWVLSLFGGDSVSHVYEVSEVDPSPADPARRRVAMAAQNLTWANVLRVQETVTYRPDPARPAARTRFSQEARITALAGGWAKIRNRVEELSVDVFSQNAKKGREGFEAVLQMSRRVFGEQRAGQAEAAIGGIAQPQPQ